MAAARTARRTLQGLFAVYKAPGVGCRTVQGTVQAKLMKDLNLLKGPPPRQLVRFLPGPVEGSAGKELTMTVLQVPSLADHPLVSGPALSHLKIGVGSQLDRMSSGVLVLSVGYGNKLLPDLFKARFTKTYTVRGLFGKATDDFSEMGKLIEKVTFDHVRSEQLERILCVIQGTHHKALLQPPRPPSLLHLRHYCRPEEGQEPDGSRPLNFLKGPANPRRWTVSRSMGEDYQQPLWRVALISLTSVAFLLWCTFRSRTEIDQWLEDALEGKFLESEPETPPEGQEKP